MIKRENLYKVIKNPYKLITYSGVKGMLKHMPDLLYLKLLYRGYMDKKLNLDSPKTFNEKLQWLKLYDRNPLYTHLVDKYEVKKHISDVLDKEYLIPLLGVYNDFDEIDFNKLPNEFVLKCTHDSGGLVICKDKSNFDLKLAKEKINRCLNRNFYYLYREWPYKKIKPRIICEQYMVDESGTELKDYKIFCFSGEPKIIEVDYNRFSGHKRNLYDIKWNYIPASIQYPTDPKTIIRKPDRVEDILGLARALAKDYPHVRIDFYSINKRIYFGEITFYHGSGFEKFEPKSLGIEMGSWIKLPIDK